MLVNWVRLDGKNMTCFCVCVMYDRIKNKIWPERYYFIVNIGTILVSQFRSSGPARRVSGSGNRRELRA